MKATIKLEDGRTLDVTINDEQLKQFTKDEPMTWEKLGEIKGWYINASSDIGVLTEKFSSSANKNTYPTKEHAEAALAEAQLLQLRNWYRGDWKPKLNEDCFDVYVQRGEFKIGLYIYAADGLDFFSFQSEEVAERFLNEQRELLEVWAKKFSA